ncbi:hypothetical protein GCM10009735_58320 [Actinomadura chokoriensis]
MRSGVEVLHHLIRILRTCTFTLCNVLTMRTAYKCRAYPDSEQAAIFSRTFGCVRLV